MEFEMFSRRYFWPGVISAGAAAGMAELGVQIGSFGTKIFASGLPAGPSALLGAVSGIFYGAIYDILPQRKGVLNLRNHAIAVMGSAAATYGAAFAAATAGLIAMPSLAFLSVIFATAISVNAISRAVFGGHHPRKTSIAKPPNPLPNPQPQQRPISQRPQNIRVGQIAKNWIWPLDLSKIGINESVKRELDEYLGAVSPEIANGNTPQFHRKGDLFAYNGKLWRLPRTLSFIEDPHTRKVSAILLTVSKDRVPVLGRGRDRTAKIIYNLTTGMSMCKKKAQHDYELKLMESLKGTKGIEPLSYVRKVINRRLETKTQLITPLYKGSVQKLLIGQDPLSAKDIKRMMLSLLSGLEKLHQLPGKGMFPGYFSYHSDIKPANLLYDKDRGGYDAVISDVETVNDTGQLWGTLGWMSPGKVKCWNAGTQDVENYNKRNGQRDDIWSMGLVFASMLKNRLHQPGFGLHDGRAVAPLACIYQKCQSAGRYWDRDIGLITQQELNNEITQTKAEVALRPEGPARQKMWDIVRSMLQVDSNLRLTAIQARQKLEAIVV